jgi:murein DD-endopeptidase MepM/ murein hydrolase activator NlpD
MQDEAQKAQMARMAAQVQALKADTAELKGQVLTTAERIEARQKFLDALLTGKATSKDLAELLPRTSGRVKLSDMEARDAGVLAPFAQLEAQQLAIVDKASATAETRLRDAQTLLRRLGLDSGRFLAQSSPRLGQGGPLVPAGGSFAGDGGTDPRYVDLYVNWQRLAHLEDAMSAIPAFVPVASYTLTSGYGIRYDPFTGGRANHAGLDMAGAHGEPVMASAAGRVVRAERFGAYGMTIDIDHGRGLMTRYAHLSRINVAIGDRVEMGERIGAMGSTGRSTGTHLHYEIRVDGQPVNPRPFVESANYILAMQRSRIDDPAL